jgi:hypothetical protein
MKKGKQGKAKTLEPENGVHNGMFEGGDGITRWSGRCRRR